MNIGKIVTDALDRAGLSTSDYGMRNMAKNMLDEIIQGICESRKWSWLKRALSFVTAAGIEEVSLDKRVRVQKISPFTMRGTNPIRRLRYSPASQFYLNNTSAIPQTNPYWYRDGQMQGFSLNPSAASVIALVSSLTNYTTGTCLVINGMTRVVMTTGSITIDRLGQYIRFGTDNKAYQIASIDFGSTSTFYLSEPYQGLTAPTATFTLGDIFQKVSVLGYDSTGELIEEEIQLTGSTPVSGAKSFASLIRISKSGRTGGYITASSNAGAVINAILDPADTDIDIQTLKLYPIPAIIETINYEAYITHPHLYKDSDSPLIPSEYHNLLVGVLYAKLQTEWNSKDVSAETTSANAQMFQNMVDTDNNTDQWTIQTDQTSDQDRPLFSNLPSNYPNE